VQVGNSQVNVFPSQVTEVAVVVQLVTPSQWSEGHWLAQVWSAVQLCFSPIAGFPVPAIP